MIQKLEQSNRMVIFMFKFGTGKPSRLLNKKLFAPANRAEFLLSD